MVIRLMIAMLMGWLVAAAVVAEPASWEEVRSQTALPADITLSYGPGPEQFGELRLPEGVGPHSVVVLIHGGCWLPDFDLDHVRPLADAITGLGFATWTIEYRRPDEHADGWPDTFVDAAAGVEELRALAGPHDLDLDRITLLGHSAGGQLALWVAARPDFAPDHPLFAPEPLAVDRVVALAPIADMAAYAEHDQGCPAGARRVLGGAPEDQPERYRAVSPVENLPASRRTDLVHALADEVVPVAQSERLAQMLESRGHRVTLHHLAEPAGHFDVLLSYGAGWELLEALLNE